MYIYKRFIKMLNNIHSNVATVFINSFIFFLLIKNVICQFDSVKISVLVPIRKTIFFKYCF